MMFRKKYLEMGFRPRFSKSQRHKRFIFSQHDYPLYPASRLRHCRSTTINAGTNINFFGAMCANGVVGCSFCGWFIYSIMRIYIFIVFWSTLRYNISYSIKNDTLEPNETITLMMLYNYRTRHALLTRRSSRLDTTRCAVGR